MVPERDLASRSTAGVDAGAGANAPVGQSAEVGPSLKARAVLAALALAIAYLAAGSKSSGGSEGGEALLDVPNVSKLKLNKRPFWSENGSKWDHSLIAKVDTSNFNKTVVGTGRAPLLVAFYDPRSISFKELRLNLEATAVALADLEAQGQPVGRLGACDVTVQTFLTLQEVPQMYESWQEPSPGAFRFGQPRFFPLILIAYQDGRRIGEYKGVISREEIIKSLARLRAPRGGKPLHDAAATRDFMTWPGPLALSCGLPVGSDAAAAFNKTAHLVWGSLIFGLTSEAVCGEVFEALGPPWPKVVWVPGGNGSAASSALVVRSSAEVLGDADVLANWLFSQDTRLLQLTPDTSHLHLDRPEPLVIFLLDPADTGSRQLVEAMVAEMEAELWATKAVKQFQFVWSDCLAFGKQFGAKHKCPLVVAVDTASMSKEQITIKSLKVPPEPKVNQGSKWNSTAASRLLEWLRNVSAPWQANDQAIDTSRMSVPVKEGNGTADAEELPKLVVKPSSDLDWYLGAMPTLDPNFRFSRKDGLYAKSLFLTYHALLHSMVLLRDSFEATHGPHGAFSFAELAVVQGMDENMRMLAETSGMIGHSLRDRRSMRRLYASVEARAALLFELKNKTSQVATNDTFSKQLLRGCELLRELFERLYKELHARDRRGTVGLPTGRVLQVERRAAEGLSVREFVEQYARPGRPVIITGLNVFEEEPWTLDFFKRRCNATVTLKVRNESTTAWAKFSEGDRLPLAEFIESFATNVTFRKQYLVDWSLPTGCPAAFGPPPYRGFRMPKYFVGDYAQRLDILAGGKHSWPSLFVGSEETGSDLHIDSMGTNFWLLLLSGRKAWRFYSRKELVNMYWRPGSPEFYPDVFQYSDEHFPLLKYTERYEAVQEPGELIFIPGDSPHAVRNLEPIHGISMNYVDASNINIWLWHTLVDDRFSEFESLTDGTTVPHGLRSDQESLSFGEWKSTSWKDLTYDIA